MIHHLLLAIQAELRTGLRDIFPQRDRIVLKTDRQQPTTLPAIQLAAGKLEIHNRSREHNFTQITESITVLREFQQDFSIEIFERTPAALEQWSTLITAIILTNRDELIRSFNQGQTDSSRSPQIAKTEYRTTDYTSQHHLNDFRFLNGIPLDLETQLGLQLNFEAIGQLTLTKTNTEPSAIIETIPISIQLDNPHHSNP